MTLIFTCINYFKRRLTRFNLNIYCDHDYFFGLLFILCFAFAPIVTFTALRQWLVPAVADEPTTHVVSFYACALCKLFYELV